MDLTVNQWLAGFDPQMRSQTKVFIMKKIIYAALFLPTIAFACNGYVIGFKGINDAFDHKSFIAYADRIGYCAKSYSWHDTNSAKLLIKNTTIPYYLYGYSMGAVSVRKVLTQDLRKPEFVITIGAYRTTNVNFEKYSVRYANYFDRSGLGQTSPGTFLNVSHDKIQQEVNKTIWGQ